MLSSPRTLSDRSSYPTDGHRMTSLHRTTHQRRALRDEQTEGARDAPDTAAEFLSERGDVLPSDGGAGLSRAKRVVVLLSPADDDVSTSHHSCAADRRLCRFPFQLDRQH